MDFWRKPLAHLENRMEGVAEIVHGLTGWRRWLVAFLAGLGAALAMAPVYALPLLVVGFSTFVLLIDGASGMARPRRAGFAAGWFFGFGYFLAGIYWMAFSFFVQADQFAWMAPFAVMGMPAFLGLFYGAVAAIAVSFWRPGWSRIFWFAAVFSLLEFARGHVLTGLPWNLPGQALAGSALGAQSAAWWGVYGLTLLVVLLSAAPAVRLRSESSNVLVGLGVTFIGAALLVGAGAIRLALPEPHGSGFNGDGQHLVRIVQPNIPQREKIDWDMWAKNFDRQMEHSTGAVPPDARLFIVWPENGVPLLSEASSALSVLSRDLPGNASLIAGAVRRAHDAGGTERYYNSIAVVEKTPEGRAVTGHYDKHHLVPFGEYLPFYDFLNAVGLAQLTPYGDVGFTAGAGPRVIELDGSSFAPMVCYEAIFPGASYPKGERPDWLVTVTNDAWYGDTSGPRQHLDMARLRSIEAGLPMARSANTGISALIDGKGRILARVKLYKAGKIDAPLPPPLPPTLYAQLGDWPFLLIIAGFAAFSWWIGRKTSPTN